MDDPEASDIEPSAGGRGHEGHEARVFLSYRRDDAPDAADRLYTSLAGRFGEVNVFIDIDTIDIGAPFAKVVDDWIARSDVFLALIGRRWLSVVDRDGKRRLDDPKDYVRREIEAAFEREVRVVPVLIHGATLPSAQELPPSLAPLLERQAVEITRAYWELDVERLGNAIDRIADSLPDAAPRARAEDGAVSRRAQPTRRKGPTEAAERQHAAQVPPTARQAAGTAADGGNRRRRTALLAVAALLIAGGITFVLTRLPGNARNQAVVSEATGLLGSARASRIAIGLPAGWRQIGATADAGLPVSYPLTVSATSGTGELILGTASDVGANLLPSALSSRLGESATPQRIKLGEKQLYRFSNVTLPGASAPQTLYAIATTSGVVLAACITPPTGVSSAQVACEEILESAHLTSGSFLDPGPSGVYAAAISSALTKLAKAVRGSGARLRLSPTAGRQAIAARQLAAAYAAARTAVAAARPGPADAALQHELADGLAKLERSYAALALSARHENGGHYARATNEAISAAAALTATLAKLRTLGYTTSG